MTDQNDKRTFATVPNADIQDVSAPEDILAVAGAGAIASYEFDEVPLEPKLVDPFDPKTWTESEQLYYQNAERLFESGTPAFFRNSKPQHAAFLIEKFISHTTRSLKVLSGCLCKHDSIPLWSNDKILSAIASLLKREGTKLEIVTVEDIEKQAETNGDQHPILQLIRQMKTEGTIKGEVRISVLARGTDAEKLNHFLVMDDSSYRFEPESDPNSRTAYVGLQKPNVAKKLSTYFDYIQEFESRTVFLA